VRDALREVAVTRLVKYLPHRGFFVIRINAGELDDMFEAVGRNRGAMRAAMRFAGKLG
jgi:DNA-binding GntR family transcriptional regulator